MSPLGLRAIESALGAPQDRGLHRRQGKVQDKLKTALKDGTLTVPDDV